MNWLDIIGIGLILPTVVALISYVLIRVDKKIENLHSRITKRLLSFCLYQEQTLVFQTIISLSLEEAIDEIKHIITDGKSSQGKPRIDIAYRKMNKNRKDILKKLTTKAKRLKKDKIGIYFILVILVIAYIILRINLKK